MLNTDIDNTVATPESASIGTLSPEERARVADSLNSTGEKLLELTSNLSNDQWHFKPAAGQWSIGEITEHVVLVEKRVQERVRDLANAEEAEPGRDSAQLDESIMRAFPYTTKVQAPAFLLPSGEWKHAKGIEQFLETRSETMALLDSAPALRGRISSHPLLGALDGYQWIMAAAGHSAHHIEQIVRIKSAPDFPPV